MNKQKAIIVDLDGTLCDTTHRQHFMDRASSKKDWVGFTTNIINDTPHKWCVEIMLAMASRGYQVIFLTGRESTEQIVEDTDEWLERYVYNVPVTFSVEYLGKTGGKIPIFRRKKGDFRKDAIVKEELYREHIEPYYDVLFCVDDRRQVVDMWRRIGLTCLQCAPGEF